MESSQVTGESKDCNSSESGWTMYLMSPLHGEVEGGDSKDSKSRFHGYNEKISHEYANDDDDDDDSMASDASSGPAQCHEPDEGSHGDRSLMGLLKFTMPKKEKDSKKKNIVETKREEKKKTKGSKKEQSATSFHGSSQVRKMKR